MDLQTFFRELLVVIVVYKMKPEQCEAFNSLQTIFHNSSAPPAIFVYDNSPEPALFDSKNLNYVHDPANPGVSKAYNEAAVVARGAAKKWMLFLDQDTKVESMLFRKFSEAVSRHPGTLAFVPEMTDRRGRVSPFYFVRGKAKRIKVLQAKCSLRKYRFVNSGLLIGTDAFLRAGGYDERIQLDFSDIAFGGRLSKVADHFRVIDFRLEHAFSGTANLTVSEALIRFEYFCNGALNFGKQTGQTYLYIVHSFLRAINLCFRYGNIRFLLVFFHRAI